MLIRGVASIRAAFLAITCLHKPYTIELESRGSMAIRYKRNAMEHGIGFAKNATESSTTEAICMLARARQIT